MPFKNIEDQRASERRWYHANKEAVIAKKARRRADLKAYVQNLKETTPCTDCGVNYPFYVMDFDHVRGEKVADINRLMGSVQKTLILAEIDKCDIVCSNCHRRRTHERSNNTIGV